VEEGRFHIYAIDHVQEGWPILTGLEAGSMQEDETFPEGTIHERVVKQLDEFVMEWRGMSEDGEEEDPDEDGSPQVQE
jgi:hypothetical protein